MLNILSAVTGAIDTVADKFFVDAADKEKFKLQALKMAQDGEFRSQENQLNAILAEAKSSDPWTSRARPSFLYVMYLLILFSLPMGVLSAFKPDIAVQVATGMQSWLSAIPDGLWGVFGAGYLGYVGAREYGKSKLIGK
ncbi:MAG: hypothetical protein HN597_16590 [Desulfobacula sp.]|jgi:hypothetical protein|uniref:3TM-type holin n=1 Tax=Desulfobacula sp. TaxID=2593537 RepID=UPI0039B989F2|nr:hypothetical protein [Desulfobacula sp.]